MRGMASKNRAWLIPPLLLGLWLLGNAVRTANQPPVAFISRVASLFDARVAHFVKFFKAIEVGMPRETVMETMNRLYPAGGPRTAPKLTSDEVNRLHFRMDTEGQGEPNAEGISVLFDAEGRVERKYYSPD